MCGAERIGAEADAKSPERSDHEIIRRLAALYESDPLSAQIFLKRLANPGITHKKLGLYFGFSREWVTKQFGKMMRENPDWSTLLQ